MTRWQQLWNVEYQLKNDGNRFAQFFSFSIIRYVIAIIQYQETGTKHPVSGIRHGVSSNQREARSLQPEKVISYENRCDEQSG
jgi:hypothetical protein